jgi:excisionase family DNA binding protein
MSNNLQLSVSVQEATHIVGLSKSYLYKLMGAGILPFLNVGRRRLISIHGIHELLRPKPVARVPGGP